MSKSIGWIATVSGAMILSFAPAFGQPPQPGRELPNDSVRPNYVLGSNDQILIRAANVEEINEKPFRLDREGMINLPLVGRVKAGGATVQELEQTLAEQLGKFVRQPLVSITVTQFRSEPVFFVGAFRVPGIYPLLGRRTLLEMLTGIGGLQPYASRRIKVTRRQEAGAIPLANAVEDPDKKSSSIEISLASLRDNVNPAEDIVLQPFDVVTVERAEMVYVTGEVTKAGALELAERDSISLTQALTMAGGINRDGDKRKVRVLRPVMNSSRRAEIEIDAKRVFEGKDNDFPLMPNDVLYVSRNSSGAVARTIGASMLTIIPYIIFAARR